MSRALEIDPPLDYGSSPESTAEVDAWLEAHGRAFTLFIGNEWQAPAGGESFETANPATGQPLARVAQAGDADVDRAVAAARAAQAPWHALGGARRAEYLYAIARHIQKHARFLAVLETLDNGKPIRESRDIDVPLVARHFYHHAGWAALFEQEFEGMEPVGVAGQIIPWNFPLLMLAWKIAPALAAGNTVVLKPAEYTPLTSLRFAEICREVGLPPGVVNIVTGDGRTGEALVRHPGVDKIAFTGSTEVGRFIRTATAGTGKKLTLELGGKSPFVVFDDCDLDSVVEGVVDAIWFNQGEVCCAGSRILVQESIADELTARLRERMERLRVGDPLDKTIDIGAIVAPVQLEKIRSLVEQGRHEGAHIWQPSSGLPRDGLFYPPTLCTNVAPADTLAQVEIFGPVVVLMTFRTPDEAVALANNTRYGLAASVWTENINLALGIAPRIRAGTVWVNCTNVFDAASGFGGYRESGFGREGGREGLAEYVKRAVPGLPALERSGPRAAGTGPAARPATQPNPAIDRTWKLFIGGRQVRPDQGYSRPVQSADGVTLGLVGVGGRKDIRNAVEAARAAANTWWDKTTAHGRAQILYFIAENLAARRTDFADLLAAATGTAHDEAAWEIDQAVREVFHWAAWADKHDGAVHAAPHRAITLAMHEPVGVAGVVCPNASPLLGLVALTGALLACGNTVVAVPSETMPIIALELAHVLESSDLPAGVLNIVSGPRAALASVLAAHDDVDGVWYFAGDGGGAEVERLSAGNLKRTWVRDGVVACSERTASEDRELLRRATEIKNIWIPYGE